MAPVEGPSSYFFSPEAAAAVAAEIAEAGQVEVFFIGRRDATGLIVEIESRAFGNEGQVPAMTSNAQAGEVVIHNHPSGELIPSDADLSVSAMVGSMGIGSYIVNNDCSRCRVIVKPSDPKVRVLLDDRDVVSRFAAGSTLAKAVGGFEDRSQQRDMAGRIVASFNADSIAVVEAGTGTGKSLAYLVPSVLYALQNKERIVISTNTINLQEQLLNKDIPAVKEALGEDFTAVLVKGRSNYVCKRKAAFAAQENTLLVEPEFRAELQGVLAWIKESPTGDRGELPVPPSPEVWERVESEADNCLRVRCPFYQECFYYESRRRAARADLLIVNHSLLLSDLAVRAESENWTMAAVLPPYTRVVLDEAHHLEDVATRHLSREITRASMRRLFGRLYRSDRSGAGGAIAAFIEAVMRLAKSKLIAESDPLVTRLLTEIAPRVSELREQVDNLLAEFGHQVLELANLDVPRRPMEHSVRLTKGIMRSKKWEDDCAPQLLAIIHMLTEFLSMNSEVRAGFRECEPKVKNALENAMMEWGAVLGRLDERRRILQGMLLDDTERCRWVELAADNSNRLVVRLNLAPVEVGKVLRENLHARMKSQTMTSATLSVDSGFQFFLERTGLVPPPKNTRNAYEDEADAPVGPDKEPKVDTLRLASPFKYNEQVFLGVPSDLGDPRASGFDAKLADLIVRSVAVSDGRALILFTSHGQLRRCFDLAAPSIRRLGYATLRQGDETRDRLLNKFRDDETSVLFATSSFWEGIDVRGRALELLILAKLPFAQPTEPVQQAQVEALEARGQNSFEGLIIPRAIIRFKQGFGRLIRSATDRGAVLIADERVIKMRYGRRFLDALPECDARFRTTDQLMSEMQEFYAKPRRD